jgi:uncharacterized protein (DUF302 family)
MLYTITIDKNINIVKSEIQEKAQEVGFGVLKEYEFQQILQTKGHPIDKDITVFELCNPVAAQAALTSHPEISVYLPCRVSIYENEGKTIISTIGLEDILNSFELEDEFKAHMSTIFDKLKKLITSLE